MLVLTLVYIIFTLGIMLTSGVDMVNYATPFVIYFKVTYRPRKREIFGTAWFTILTRAGA